MIAPPPDPPELPDRARPWWPAWVGPVALAASFFAIGFVILPLLPLLLVIEAFDGLEGVTLLVLLLAQDALLVGFALLFASIRRKPRGWHFGIRPTRLWPTVGWAALAFALMLGFELGWIELLDVDEGNVEDLESTSVISAVSVAIGVIVVAPVTEELFFRGFFYRALRTRLRVWSASLVDGVVFGALHFQGIGSLAILPVIAFFGVGQCLLYERTGSLFAVIAVHAAFNTFATLALDPVAALAVGVAVLAGCVLVPRFQGAAPSPFSRRPAGVPA